MKFPRAFLANMGGKTISDTITGTSRWSIYHTRIFEHDGRFYQTLYSVGATEMQDEGPYEWTDSEIECIEVFPHLVEVTQYIPKECEQE